MKNIRDTATRELGGYIAKLFAIGALVPYCFVVYRNINETFNPIVLSAYTFLLVGFLVTAFLPNIKNTTRILSLASIVYLTAFAVFIKTQNIGLSLSFTLVSVVMFGFVYSSFRYYLWTILQILVIGVVGYRFGTEGTLDLITQVVVGLCLALVMARSISSVIDLLISQAKELSNSLLKETKTRNKLDLLTQHGEIGLYEVDVNRSVMTANNVIKQRLGLPLDESEIPLDVLFDSLEDVSIEKAKALLDVAKDLPHGYVNQSLEKQRFHDGSVHFIRILEYLEIRDGHPIFSGAAIDVTEEVVAKQKSEQSAIELQKKQDQQAQMYAVVGHELRTPAASLQMLLDDSENDGVLDRSIFKSNIEQLLSVIDTLSAVAQPERMQQAAFKEVVLDELLSSQIHNLQGLAIRNKIKLSTDLNGLVSEPLYLQASLLRQVTSNLIKNAILHSQGSEVILSASVLSASDKLKRLQIRVADNGRGIPEDSLSRIFEAFERGDSKAEGTGLGLFVCREIMHMMGGELRYETSKSGGAEFIIDLVVSVVGLDIKESLIPPDVLRGKRVLIAEDNAVIRMLTTKMLEKEGAIVTAFNDGQQAMNTFTDGQFDLVMSDIFMPELDGYGLVKGLRAAGYTGPVVGLTAATIGTETDLMLQAGADFVISKPIDLLKVQQFLSDYEAQRNG